ncbi:GNAT family N-acetyltransferase [Streptococcus orisasini]|uniref:GNAT family N-acetyltransferase n=1 Tax=Streptococcus orisasini TaxID=1080071 RepID=UPI00070AF1F6|nr:GNAT family N-acetyltransferase [Streptococcus orisasini]
MLIRQVQLADLEAVNRIEAENFSAAEAAAPEAMKERIEKIADTFLVAEQDDQLVGYIEGPVVMCRYLTDDLFQTVQTNPPQSGYIAVTSLSVAKDFQKQGIGTTLLAVLKDLAVAQKRLGISLTCHEHLISYYEMNGFTDEGLSTSNHGGSTWYNMVWDNPEA